MTRHAKAVAIRASVRHLARLVARSSSFILAFISLFFSANSIQFSFRCQLMTDRTKWQTLFYKIWQCVCAVHSIFYFITSIFAVIYYSIYTARFFCTFTSFFSSSTNLPIIYSPTYSSGKLLSFHMNNNDNTTFFNDCCLHLMSIKKKTKYYVRISIIFCFFFYCES